MVSTSDIVLSAVAPEPRQRAFSYPAEPFEHAYVEDITVKRTRRLLSLFLKQFGRLLDEHGEGARAMLEAFLETRTSFEVVWHPAFGRLRQAFSTRPPDPVEALRAAAMMLCRLTEWGMPGHWRLELAEPSPPPLFCLSRSLLPSVHRIEVDSDGESAVIETAGATGRARFRLEEGRLNPHPGEESGVPEGTMGLPRVRIGAAAGHEECRADDLLLLPEQFIPGILESDSAVPITEASVQGYEAAFILLRDYAPHYHQWVRRAVRCLVPLRSSGGKLNSFSVEAAPGLVALSLEVPPLAHAELLVHEATHQYCYLLKQVGPLDDGSDTKLYYSPVRRMDRPISAILIAYHAFANILLFYRDVRNAGISDAETCLNTEKRIWPQLRELEVPLRSSQALTQIGRALFEPLAERLRSGSDQTLEHISKT